MPKNNVRLKVVHLISSLNDGGAESVLYRLISNDLNNEHAVICLTHSGKYGHLLEKIGVELVALEMPRGRITLQGLRNLMSTVKQTQPNVIQTWMYHADLLGAIIGISKKIPVVWCIRNSTVERGMSRLTKLIVTFNKHISRWLPSRIVCCAERAKIQHKLLGFYEEKMTVIQNGYEKSIFLSDSNSRHELRSNFNIPPSVPVIGTVGRFDIYKDHENLFRSLSTLKKRGRVFVCVLVGRGLDISNFQLNEMLRIYGVQDNVRLLGVRDDISKIMNMLDLHVLPSCSEGFPNVLAEAMACGIPCVTTDVGDARFIVGETGWVVTPRNPEALANAIEEALENLRHSNWMKRCLEARQRIEREFSVEKMVSQYCDVWKAAVDSARVRPAKTVGVRDEKH